MSEKKKYILSFISAAVIFCLLLSLFSMLAEPKYVTESREGNLISEYYAEVDAGRAHDVIFVGDCEAYSSFLPPMMYERYGITSFVRASPSQSMAQSYYLIKETLAYEEPRAVVFSVYAVCREGSVSEAYNRMTLDGMRMSYEKLCAVRESLTEGESILSYFLPLLRFHSRIYELTEDDFKYLLGRPTASHNGYFMQKGIMPPSDSERGGDLAEPLPRENLDYLDRMLSLCRESGVELILVKTPTDSWRYPWYDEWSLELREYADERGISYYDLRDFADEIGIDMRYDSYDGGMHLNVWGAEKVSEYFGAILKEGYGISGERNEIWDKKLDEYYKERG